MNTQPTAPLARMDQPKLTGYRMLSDAEGRLINEIKAKGEELQALVDRVKDIVQAQRDDASADTAARHDVAEPGRWLAMARTDLQTGVMRLVRAVAQPMGF